MKWKILPFLSSRNRPLWWVAVFILSALAHSAHGQAIKLLPLGDSWTSGHEGYVSYRYDLWFELVDKGFDVDFVGDLTDTYHETNLDLYPLYLTDFDRDHSGYSGFQTSQLVSIAMDVVISRRPDIVLLWAGGNDLRVWGRYEYIESVNEVIEQVASDMDTPESRVILVDHYTGFEIGSMTQDDSVHHNRTGEAWIAANWFEALAGNWPTAERSRINAGHSGAWFNQDTVGQGQLIDVEPESQFMFVSWFTFTDAASANPNEQHWLTAQGNYSGDTAELILYETLGGRFDNPQAVSIKPIGEVTLSFTDCGHGQMSYSIDTLGLQGSFPLSRAIPGSENVCENRDQISAGVLDLNDGRDGAWYNPETPGQGFLIDAHPNPEGDDFIFLAWFTYGDTTNSGQRWLTAQRPLVGSAVSDSFQNGPAWIAEPNRS